MYSFILFDSISFFVGIPKFLSFLSLLTCFLYKIGFSLLLPLLACFFRKKYKKKDLCFYFLSTIFSLMRRKLKRVWNQTESTVLFFSWKKYENKFFFVSLNQCFLRFVQCFSFCEKWRTRSCTMKCLNNIINGYGTMFSIVCFFLKSPSENFFVAKSIIKKSQISWQIKGKSIVQTFSSFLVFYKCVSVEYSTFGACAIIISSFSYWSQIKGIIAWCNNWISIFFFFWAKGYSSVGKDLDWRKRQILEKRSFCMNPGTFFATLPTILSCLFFQDDDRNF